MNRITPGAALAALLACLAPSQGADAPKTVEDRLKEVETQLQQLKQENDKLRQQYGLDAKAAAVLVKAGGKEQKLSIGGLFQGQAEFGGDPDARYSGIENRFLLRRARLNVSGSFAEQFDFKLEGDFGANSLSEKTGYSAQLTDAYVNWNRYAFANVKMGQFKTPYGYEQLIPDPKVPTVERSLPNDRLTDGRQIGVGVAGDIVAKRLAYSVGAFNGTSVNNSFNDNDKFLYAGRLSGTPLLTQWGKQEVRLTLGVNGLFSTDNNLSKSGFGFDAVPGGAVDNLFSGDRVSWGADAQFNLGPFDLQGEYLQARFDPRDRIPATHLTADGWYLMGSYYILPKKLQGLVRFESFDPNTHKRGNSTDVWTFGLTYYLKGDDLKLGLNYLLGNPAGGVSDGQGRLMLRIQYVF